MIIIEGPDGSGKSTLIRQLSKDLALPIAPKVVSSDTKPLVDLDKWTELNLNAGFQEVLFDRHRLISEPIYGPATRSQQHVRFMDLGWMSEMMGRFYGLDPIIIYCLPPLNIVRANVNREDTDNEAVRGRIAAIYAGYVARATADIARGVGKLYNYQTTQYTDALHWIQWGLQKRRNPSDAQRRFPRPLDRRA